MNQGLILIGGFEPPSISADCETCRTRFDHKYINGLNCEFEKGWNVTAEQKQTLLCGLLW